MQSDRHSHQFTRQELYEKVWRTPMRLLAKEFGLSDVGLAKICRSYRIPTPGVGYWAKKEAGRRVKPRKLPVIKDPAFQEIVIRKRSADPEGALAPEVSEAIAFEMREENRIVVAENLRSAHPLVRETSRLLRDAGTTSDGLMLPQDYGALDITVTPANLQRSLRVMDAIVKALSKRGHDVVVLSGDDARGYYRQSSRWRSRLSTTVAKVNGELIEFRLREELRQEKEKPDPGRFTHRYERIINVPSGRLSLLIDRWGAGVRCRWTDGRRQRVEDKLNSFLVSLYKIAAAAKVRRKEKEEEEQRLQETRKIEDEKRRREEEERARREHLMAEVGAWHRAEQIRAYVEAVREAVVQRSGPIESGSREEAWMAWALGEADRQDPLAR